MDINETNSSHLLALKAAMQQVVPHGRMSEQFGAMSFSVGEFSTNNDISKISASLMSRTVGVRDVSVIQAAKERQCRGGSHEVGQLSCLWWLNNLDVCL